MCDAEDERPLLTAKRAAERLHISMSTFHNYVRQGVLPPALPGTKRWDWVACKEHLSWLGGHTAPDDQRQAPEERPPDVRFKLPPYGEKALRELGKRHPRPQRAQWLDGVEESTLIEMEEAGLVELTDLDKNDVKYFLLDDFAYEDYKRRIQIDIWRNSQEGGKS